MHCFPLPIGVAVACGAVYKSDPSKSRALEAMPGSEFRIQSCAFTV